MAKKSFLALGQKQMFGPLIDSWTQRERHVLAKYKETKVKTINTRWIEKLKINNTQRMLII